ncbi:MAG: hypothetical protein LBP95_02645 [Deltaproteobacteria bacterium]|jgi:hypothetical protein|nr:hypothetical protein [Deltaproteobacteria bacterium]
MKKHMLACFSLAILAMLLAAPAGAQGPDNGRSGDSQGGSLNSNGPGNRPDQGQNEGVLQNDNRGPDDRQGFDRNRRQDSRADNGVRRGDRDRWRDGGYGRDNRSEGRGYGPNYGRNNRHNSPYGNDYGYSSRHGRRHNNYGYNDNRGRHQNGPSYGYNNHPGRHGNNRYYGYNQRHDNTSRRGHNQNDWYDNGRQGRGNHGGRHGRHE